MVFFFLVPAKAKRCFPFAERAAENLRARLRDGRPALDGCRGPVALDLAARPMRGGSVRQSHDWLCW